MFQPDPSHSQPIHLERTAKADEGAFPWRVVGHAVSQLTPIKPPIIDHSLSSRVSSRSVSWSSHIGETMGDPKVCSLLDEIEDHDKISTWLPTKTKTAGACLEHALHVMESLHDCYSPMIFKTGFTSQPQVRWENRKYGYKWEPLKWECMVILYMASEPWSAGMLEASLIDRYIVFWQHVGAAYFWWLFDWTHYIIIFEEKHVLEPMAYHIKNKLLAMSHVPAQASQGCKNLRRGGDTVLEREDTSAVYMVYVVYRSFKVKPP